MTSEELFTTNVSFPVPPISVASPPPATSVSAPTLPTIVSAVALPVAVRFELLGQLECSYARRQRVVHRRFDGVCRIPVENDVA